MLLFIVLSTQVDFLFFQKFIGALSAVFTKPYPSGIYQAFTASASCSVFETIVINLSVHTSMLLVKKLV